MMALSSYVAADPARISDRLRRFAIKLCRHSEMAEDIVHDVFIRVWSHGEDLNVDGDGFAFLAAMVRHEFMNIRNPNTMPLGRGRSEPALTHNRVSSDEVEFLRLSVAPRQEWAAELAMVERALLDLPEREREALVWRAYGEEPTEIATRLGVQKRQANKLVERARRRLLVTFVDYRPKAPRFRGVYRRARKWQAVLCPGGGKSTYLGLFDTAEEAALAYDIAAWDRFGDDALLNFPGVLTAAMASLDEAAPMDGAHDAPRSVSA